MNIPVHFLPISVFFYFCLFFLPIFLSFFSFIFLSCFSLFCFSLFFSFFFLFLLSLLFFFFLSSVIFSFSFFPRYFLYNLFLSFSLFLFFLLFFFSFSLFLFCLFLSFLLSFSPCVFLSQMKKKNTPSSTFKPIICCNSQIDFTLWLSHRLSAMNVKSIILYYECQSDYPLWFSARLSFMIAGAKTLHYCQIDYPLWSWAQRCLYDMPKGLLSYVFSNRLLVYIYWLLLKPNRPFSILSRFRLNDHPRFRHDSIKTTILGSVTIPLKRPSSIPTKPAILDERKNLSPPCCRSSRIVLCSGGNGRLSEHWLERRDVCRGRWSASTRTV